MKKLATIFALLGVVLLGVGCQPDEPKTPITDQSTAFKITIDNLTKTTVDFSIEPLEKDVPYLVMVIDKATFDSFENEDAYLDDDMEYLRESAEYYDKTLREYLREILEVGDLQASVSSLQPNTEYYIYAYHLTVNGEIISDLVKKEFKTEGYTLNEDTFKISISDIAYDSAVVTVTPSSSNTAYFVNVVGEEDLELYGGGEDAYVIHLERLREYYLNKGASVEDMIANLCFVGTKSIKIDKLIAGTKYYAYALSVDDDFFACSEVEVVEFSTASPDATDLRFEFEVEAQYDRAVGSVVPSNDNDTYICSVQLAESLYWYEDEESFIYALLEELKYWQGGVENSLRSGVTDLSTIYGLVPETDYIVVCFGYNGAPTTELFTYQFTTAAADGNPANLSVEFEALNLAHNTFMLHCCPSEAVYYYATTVSSSELEEYVATEGSQQEALLAIANDEIESGAKYFGMSRAQYLKEMAASVGECNILFDQLTPATDYYALAVAVDMQTGELASQEASLSEVITTTEKVIGDAVVEFHFGDYYDGSALAELDPEKYNSCRGKAFVPYTISTNASAVEWYTTIIQEDPTQWGTTDEYIQDFIFDTLVTYGVEFDVESIYVNSISGTALLPYDTKFSFLGIAKDADGEYGIGKLVVKEFSVDGAAPAEEYVASLATPAQVVANAARRVKGEMVCAQRGVNNSVFAMRKPDNTSAQKSAPKDNESTLHPLAGVRFLPTK